MNDTTPVRVDGPPEADEVLVLAHGAGAPMDSPFLEAIASGVAAGGVRVVRFEFPYMAARREGRRPPPDREPVLREAWRRIVEQQGRAGRVTVGGKSLGGRIASLVADELGVRGLVCLGYPFHPVGKPEKLRVQHLQALATPALILQGTRDPFGNLADLDGYRLSPRIEIHWIEDGDHSFRPRARSGRSLDQNLAEVVESVTGFLRRPKFTS